MFKKIVKILVVVIMISVISELIYIQYNASINSKNKNNLTNTSTSLSKKSTSTTKVRSVDTILNPSSNLVNNLPKDGILNTSTTTNTYDVTIVKVDKLNVAKDATDPYTVVANISVKNNYDKNTTLRFFKNSKYYDKDGGLLKLEDIKVGEKVRIISILNLGISKSTFHINIRKI